MAFSHAGMPLRWEGKAGTLSETGVVAGGELKGRTVLRINPKYFRPAEVRELQPLPRLALPGRGAGPAGCLSLAQHAGGTCRRHMHMRAQN